MTERKYNWIIGGLVTVAVLGIVFLIFFDPIMAFFSPKEETPVEPVIEVVAPVEDVKEPEPNPDEAGGAARPNVPDTNIGTGGEPVEMSEDGTYTEAPENNTTTTQPPVEQTTPVQQNPAPANNGDSGNGGSGSNSGSSSNSGSVRTGSVIVNGKTISGVRYFDSVEDLNGVSSIGFSETVSVGGVPYIWTGTEWADYSGFYTEVIELDLGEWDGTYVGY